ncbi:MAG: sigma-70 family RNA polymerase sigma factor [Planctomycetes bacterium]|nr:sigma-70 family RNA polymerase sigma factor [Planctomycetota bacterium]
MAPTDGELVEAVRRGRREAYDELVRRHAARIGAACWSRLGRRGPVEDMVQETFLRGYRAIGTLAEPEKIGSWLYGIAVRTCLDWLKAKERSQVSLDSPGPGGAAADPSDGRLPSPAEDREGNAKLLSEVEALPEIYRETLVMFYFRKQTYREMSAVLGITPAAINARLAKARAILRERLGGAATP